MKKTFERLLDLPPEIWGSITFYIPGEQVSRLKSTGSRYLWYKMRAKRAIWSIFLGRNGIPFKHWPAFLSDLSHIEELCIYDIVAPWFQEFRMGMLPKSLRRLTFWFSRSPVSLVKGVNVESLLSNLEKLQLNIKWNRRNSWVTKYKWETLTSLHISRWDCSVPLPALLTNLIIDNVSPRIHSENLGFPRTLKTLKIGVSENIELLWPLLPPNLLSLSLSNCIRVAEAKMSQLPESLTKLNLKNLVSNTCPSPLSKVSKLSVVYLPTQFWPDLPETLKNLKIQNVFQKPGLAPPPKSEVSSTQIIPFWSLPRSITKLWISFDEFANPITCTSPEGLSSASSPHPSVFPPLLEDFTLKNAQLTAESAQSLPPSLTSLSLSNLCESVCEKLPRNLLRLSSEKALVSHQMISSLPRSLTWLRLSGLKGNNRQNVFAIRDLSTSVKENETKSGDPSYCFPAGLRYLKLSQHRLLDNYFMSQPLPNLEVLSLKSPVLFTDSFISRLPRSLTTLDLAFAGQVTGKCFPSLPRHLRILKLSRSPKIVDSDIQHLPTSLVTLKLECAIHLTNACVKHLPPSLTNIYLMANSEISIDCAADMPFSVRHPLSTGRNTFLNSSWSIFSGVATPNGIEEIL